MNNWIEKFWNGSPKWFLILLTAILTTAFFKIEKGQLFLPIMLIIVLILAKLFGELFEKFGQSAVLGELTVGLILGPSLFNILIPSENIVFSFLAEIGVILLLFEVGLQSNLYKMLKVGFPSLMVAIIGVILPVTFGYIYYTQP